MNQKNLDFESNFDGVTAAPSGREYVKQHGVVVDLDVVIAQSVQNAGGVVVVAASGAYAITEALNGKVLVFTNAGTKTITVPVTLSAKFKVFILNLGAGAATIDPAGATTVNGVATIDIAQNSGCQLAWDSGGAAYYAVLGSSAAASGTDVWSEVPTDSGDHATFDLAHTPLAGTLRIYQNGLRLVTATHYTVSTSHFTLTSAGDGTENYVVDYSY